MNANEDIDSAVVFARTHLRACCSDILYCKKYATYPEGGEMRRLILICHDFAGASAVRVAESIVADLAMEQVLTSAQIKLP